MLRKLGGLRFVFKTSVRRVTGVPHVCYVARSRQVCIYVVEALLIAIYLTEKKDVYIHIRPTLLPEATPLPEATSFSWGLPS
jgi:hypothetical protein